MPFFTDLAWPLLLLVAVSTCRATTPTTPTTTPTWEYGPSPTLGLKLVKPPYIKMYDSRDLGRPLGNLYVGSYADLHKVRASPRLRVNAIFSVVIPEGLGVRCWQKRDFAGSEYSLTGPRSGNLASAEGSDNWESCKVYPLLGYYVDIYHGYSFQPSVYGESDLASASFYKDDCSDLPSYGTGTQVVTWDDPWLTGVQNPYSLGDYSRLPRINSVDSISIPLGLTVRAYGSASYVGTQWFCPGGTMYQLETGLDGLGINDWDSMKVERANWCIFNSQRKDVCGVRGTTGGGEEFKDPGCQRDRTCPLLSVELLGEVPQATTLGLKVISSGIVANCGDEGANAVTLDVDRTKSYTEKTEISIKSMESKSWDTSTTTGVEVAVKAGLSPFGLGVDVTATGSYSFDTAEGGKTSLTNSETKGLSTTLKESIRTGISVPVNFASLLMITSTEYAIQSAEVSAEFTYTCTGEEPQQEDGSITVEGTRWDSPTVRPVTKSFPSAEKCFEMRDKCLNRISHTGALANALEMEMAFIACFVATPIDPFTEGSGAPTIALGTASLVSALSLMLA